MVGKLLRFKPRIFTIEINDKKINTEMSKLIYKIEQSVTDLTVAINNVDILGKMADSKSLLNMFLGLNVFAVSTIEPLNERRNLYLCNII